MISGAFYTNEVLGALKMFGAMGAAEIKAKLLMKNIKLDESQVLEAIDVLIKRNMVKRSDVPGKFKA